MDITHLLKLMAEHDASDLYLTEESTPMYKIDGLTHSAGKTVLNQDQVKELLYSVMTEKQIADFEANNEVNLAIEYKAIGRFRLNVYRQRGAVAGVFRRIKSYIPTIEELRLPKILKDIALTKRGLVLVVGATGSGKSTTLASLIDYRNQNLTGHIITIEDPIEYVYEHKKSIVSQREVGMDTDSFDVALKNALRQAPDVVLVGEIRDKKTMEAAISFAETGHLCLATLHSSNTYQALERIMNFFPPEQHNQIFLQLSLNLKGILSQRLIPSLDDSRVPAMEIMLDSPRIKDLIHKGEVGELKEAIEKSTHLGMQTFDQSVYELFKYKLISLENALSYADSANNVRLRIKLDDDPDETKKLKKKKDSMRARISSGLSKFEVS